jgi:hypothetical protein
LNGATVAGHTDWFQGTTGTTCAYGGGNGCIFTYLGAQQNPWTLGTGSSAATIMFNGGGTGNNAQKIYIPTGAPQFTIPTGYTQGTSNNVFTGDFAQANGFPLYFWFAQPTFGAGGVTQPTSVNMLNGLDLASAPATLTILGYNGLANQGGTLIPGDVFTIGTAIGTTPRTITLDWANVTAIYFVDSATGTCFGGYACDSQFYVNNIEVNDAVPLPGTVALFGSVLAGGLGMSAWRNRRRSAGAISVLA